LVPERRGLQTGTIAHLLPYRKESRRANLNPGAKSAKAHAGWRIL
jgi:hypothetical protein